MTTEMTMIVVLAGVVISVVAVVVYLVVRTGRAGADDHLSEAIQGIRYEIDRQDSVLGVRVEELNHKLAAIQGQVESREATLEEQVRGIGSQVQSIAGLFTNDRARGGWGEVSLLRIFELGGLVEDRDYTVHFQSGGGVPDAVVNLPGGRSIVIDAKFPVARYNEALATDDPSERNRLLLAQGRELERMGRDLVERGYRELASGGWVVMYLPSQAVYEASVAVSQDVIERLLERRVVVAGPNTLFALIMSVSALLTEHRALQQADEILEETRELNRRMGVFVGHLGDIGKSLDRTLTAFNRAIGSWSSRVAPQLTRISELSGHDDPASIEPIDQTVRVMETEERALMTMSYRA